MTSCLVPSSLFLTFPWHVHTYQRLAPRAQPSLLSFLSCTIQQYNTTTKTTISSHFPHFSHSLLVHSSSPSRSFVRRSFPLSFKRPIGIALSLSTLCSVSVAFLLGPHRHYATALALYSFLSPDHDHSPIMLILIVCHHRYTCTNLFH